jgi:glycosyltransferase involved in cell wall biosynthesis
MRLAWFTPWPPQQSGVAGRSAEVVQRLAARGHAIDVFVDEKLVELPPARANADPPASGAVRVQSAHDFLWRHARGQYDLTVYQIGNSKLHSFIWPYLFQIAGLVVLHELCVHHARGRALLMDFRADDYRAEFAWNQPDDSADAAELAIRGFNGPYYYQWPMVRAAIESARLAASHAVLPRDWQDEWPDTTIEHIALGDGVRRQLSENDRIDWRRALGLSPDATVFGVFGGLTEEKRVQPILRAFAAVRRAAPDVHLVLAGAADFPVHVRSLADSLGIGDVTHMMGVVDDAAFDTAIGAVDVSLHLRWPTALETSGPWLLALSAERPTVLTDLAHLTGVPTLDPRTWHLHAPIDPAMSEDAAVAVAVDILDEDHSLRLALSRLATDSDLRTRLGRAGHAWWQRFHTVDRMVDDYERAITNAVARPDPATTLPTHMRPDPWKHAHKLLRDFDVTF